jgi:hypothetical protein
MLHDLETYLPVTNNRSIGNAVHAEITRYCSRLFTRRNQTGFRKSALVTLNVYQNEGSGGYLTTKYE